MLDKPIGIVTFKWHKEGYRSKFTAEHVNTLYRMIKRNTTVPFKMFCVTDDQRGIDPEIETVHLWPNPCPRYGSQNADKPNCFYRLKMFDPEVGGMFGDRFIWIDLDCVVTGNIDHILNDQADLKLWKPDGEFMPCNGSLCLHRVGTRTDIWKTFNPQRVHPVTGFRNYASRPIGSDQAWIALNMTDKEKENTFGLSDGVVSYRCHMRKGIHRKNPPVTELPKIGKIVMFHGRWDPWDEKTQKEAPWILEHIK